MTCYQLSTQQSPDGTLDDAISSDVILDIDILQETVEALSDDIRKRALDSFAVDICACRDGVARSLRIGDIQAMQSHSHTLKSVAGTFGATRLYLLASQINNSCRRGDGLTAARLFPDMDRSTNRTLAELAAYSADNLLSGGPS